MSVNTDHVVIATEDADVTGTPKTSSSTDVEKRFLDLLEGQKVLVRLGQIADQPPAWYDPAKFQRGQEFFRRNFAGIFLAHLLSLITLLSSPQILKPLIFTQRSETTWKAFRRYISTVVHVSCWYKGDVWRKGDPARNSIQMVRNKHNGLARSMNTPDKWNCVNSVNMSNCGDPLIPSGAAPLIDAIKQDTHNQPACPYITFRKGNKMDSTEEYMFFNQYDMVETQFAFVGVALLFPLKFGAYGTTDDDLRGFIHFWRCIGHLMGIEDRFNFCNEDDVEFTRNLSAFYLDKMIKPAFQTLSIEYEHMARAVATGARYYHPGITYESLFVFNAYVIGVEVAKTLSQLTYAQWFHYLYMRFIFSFICWIPGAMWCLSALFRFTISLVVDRPRWWPSTWNPPTVDGLASFWNYNPKTVKAIST